MLELFDLVAELAAALDDLSGEASDDTVDLGERGGELVQGAAAGERAGGLFKVGVELVQMPAQPADDPGSFLYQVFAVIDKQP